MSDTIQHPAATAATAPDRPAVIMGSTGEVVTYGDLEARSCRVANLLQAAGIGRGDNVAVLVENRAEYFEVTVGALRIGCYVTPINWHLSAEEAAYIVEDCGASALFASATVREIVEAMTAPERLALRVAIGGLIDGFDDYEDALAAQSADRPDGECEGNWMFYSSGTTGRPKGIKPPDTNAPFGAPTPFTMLVQGLYGGGPDTVYLSPAPLYHAAPSGWTSAMLRLGGTAVVMERFDPEQVLALIERHRVTHVQFVPTHMVRLLKLPAEVRERYDTSSLRYLIHAAAPCPPDVKRATIEWLGPIVYEYYSGSEGAGFCAIDSNEWLAHPGSVGKSLLGAVHITDESGTEVSVGEEGQVWFEPPGTFEYHGDPAKTAEAFDHRGWCTLGDIGRVDDEGYLYLTDRVSNMIISGGVNIYPREVEDAIVTHEAVHDVAALGVGHADLGETVRAVVQLESGVEATDELAAELIAYARDRIASFKCPTSVHFVDELPRLPTGKLAKRNLPDSVRVPFS